MTVTMTNKSGRNTVLLVDLPFQHDGLEKARVEGGSPWGKAEAGEGKKGHAGNRLSCNFGSIRRTYEDYQSTPMIQSIYQVTECAPSWPATDSPLSMGIPHIHRACLLRLERILRPLSYQAYT